MSDYKTCTSERVSFEFKRRPDVGVHRPGALMLTAHCEDCRKYAAVIVDTFDVDRIGEMWNPHHARQMLESIAHREQET